MNIIVILFVAILGFATFPTYIAYEILFPYGYNNLMMRGGYETPLVQPTDLLTLPSSRSGWSFLVNSKCSSTATGAIVIGSNCYTVTTTPTTFVAAQADCQAKGGTLAQPTPNAVLSKAFYAALKTRFPTQFATIEAAAANPGAIWIGYQQAAAASTTPLLALDGAGLSALATNPIITPVILAANTVPLAAAIVNPGSTWNALDPALATSTRPYICQFNLI